MWAVPSTLWWSWTWLPTKDECDVKSSCNLGISDRSLLQACQTFPLLGVHLQSAYIAVQLKLDFRFPVYQGSHSLDNWIQASLTGCGSIEFLTNGLRACHFGGWRTARPKAVLDQSSRLGREWEGKLWRLWVAVMSKSQFWTEQITLDEIPRLDRLEQVETDWRKAALLTNRCKALEEAFFALLWTKASRWGFSNVFHLFELA